MAGEKMLHPKHVAKLSVTGPICFYLLLSHVQAPTYAYGVLGTLVVLTWAAQLAKLYYGTYVSPKEFQ